MRKSCSIDYSHYVLAVVTLRMQIRNVYCQLPKIHLLLWLIEAINWGYSEVQQQHVGRRGEEDHFVLTIHTRTNARTHAHTHTHTRKYHQLIQPTCSIPESTGCYAICNTGESPGDLICHHTHRDIWVSKGWNTEYATWENTASVLR